MRLRYLILAASLLCLGLPPRTAFTDRPSTAPPPGLRENTPQVHALVGARLVVAPGKAIEQGTLVLRDGVIVSVGADVKPPKDARVWNLQGKTVYAGFIDAFSEIASTADTGKGPGYWNPHVTPQSRIAKSFVVDKALNKKLRSQGITARLVAPAKGVIKGRSSLVTVGDDELSRVILNDDVALHVKLTPEGRNRNQYPNSPMGALSLVRQAFYDADWHGKALAAHQTAKQPSTRPERNDALEALRPYLLGKSLVIVDAPDELYFFRADRLAREFGLNVAVRGSGNEYRRLQAVKATGRTVIVPLNFPKAPHVKTLETARNATLEELMHWDLAAENPGRLAAAGIRIALTSHGMKDPAKFLAQLRQALQRGLSQIDALRALTTTPAELFGVSSRLGTLEAGKIANLVVTDGEIFNGKTKVLETWVDGRRYPIQSVSDIDVRGTWQVRLATSDGMDQFFLEFKGETTKLTGTLKRGDLQATLSNVQLDAVQLSGSCAGKPLGRKGIVQLSVTVSAPQQGPPTFLGTIVWADGRSSAIRGKRTKAVENVNAKKKVDKKTPKKQESASKPRSALFAVNYPLGAFGRDAPPMQPKTVLFKNATVWTSGSRGILQNVCVLVEKGKIKQVDPNIKAPPGAVVIDCKGRHISPGLIDCHSHIATDGGVNESGQTITAEVRIGDFIDSDDVNIYRQLAGGVTSSNILHGSANTIGGQNQVIKMRWGALPEQIKFATAPSGVKFALGENVKQSNWGDRYSKRYPQTRMGVEQLVESAFEAAKEYRRRWDAWKKAKHGSPPRVDLELEALSEVLSGERLIHCHSYRQDEILALMRTCEKFKVRIGTFQHILEGYKVADVLARHGVGGSAFSDWWAYKFEVYDAIPYNGSLMHDAGVVVSFNSDSAELGRRLNTEAAKAVKYGGVSRAEALKFVTLNPAKQLGIDRWVGSLEPGKDADLVVWNGSPLSSFSRCEQTWVDGRKYFDREEDLRRREKTREMRAAIIQRILASGVAMAAPGETSKPKETLWPRHDEFCGHHVHDHEE